MVSEQYGIVNHETELSDDGFYYHNKNIDNIDYDCEKIKTDIFGEEKNMFKCIVSQKYSGGDGCDPDVYVLVNHSTYSEADNTAYFFKTYTDAVVIGTNTGGEGYSSFVYKTLPCSGFTFSYTPFLPNEPERTIIGTTPDYYIEETLDNFRKRIEMEHSGRFENRMKWDNVLIETLDIIKENQKNNPAE